jgi:hypothetical protein
MDLSAFKAAVFDARAKKAARPVKRVVELPVMRQKSREAVKVDATGERYIDDGNDPWVDHTPVWFAVLALVVWVLWLASTR